mmetsp:Transcript_23746/g.70482  ORF Transcript_23746/g.70482 Transcript_23746/m.70482 type:complete len:209 (+) Transcript_23746:1447-2073(+)
MQGVGLEGEVLDHGVAAHVVHIQAVREVLEVGNRQLEDGIVGRQALLDLRRPAAARLNKRVPAAVLVVQVAVHAVIVTRPHHGGVGRGARGWVERRPRLRRRVADLRPWLPCLRCHACGRMQRPPAAQQQQQQQERQWRGEGRPSHPLFRCPLALPLRRMRLVPYCSRGGAAGAAHTGHRHQAAAGVLHMLVTQRLPASIRRHACTGC